MECGTGFLFYTFQSGIRCVCNEEEDGRYKTALRVDVSKLDAIHSNGVSVGIIVTPLVFRNPSRSSATSVGNALAAEPVNLTRFVLAACVSRFIFRQ